MKVSWIFDVISPFSYLSLKCLDQLPSFATVRFVPVLFGALLSHHGQLGNAEIESKRKFTYRFCIWRARQLGISFKLPPAHPFNPIAGLRLIIAAGCERSSVEKVFDAVWMQRLDISTPEVIERLARELNIADVEKAISDPAVTNSLRDNTEWAIKKNVFGVPTFVHKDELFWGHDARDMVSDYMLHPDLFKDAQMKSIDRVPVGIVRSK